MTAIPTRGKVAAVIGKKEESALLEPTLGKHFVSVQSDFTITPNFETTENLEIRDDIMAAKPVISGENPSGTFSHYLTGSGVEGEETEYAPMVESCLGGKRIITTEHTTIAGSTVSYLNVSDAALADYAKGDAVLVKDEVNGWSMRPVKNRDLTNKRLELAFDLEEAPAAGVKLGLHLTYYPTTSLQPVFDVWEFFSAGSGNQNVANCRVTSMSMTADANGQINSTFSFEGTDYRMNQNYEATWDLQAGLNTVVVAYGTSLGDSVNLVLANKIYTSGEELATELQTKLRALTGPSLSTLTVSYSEDVRKFRFLNASGYAFDFAATASDDGMAKLLGFDEDKRTDTAVAGAGLVSKRAAKPSTLNYKIYLPLKPAYDGQPPVIAKDQRLFLGENDNNVCLDATSVSLTINTPTTTIYSICAENAIFAKLLASRDATLTVSAILQDDDQRFFSQFKNGDTVPFAFMGGQKRDRRWVAGNVFTIYGSEAVINSFSLAESDGIYTLDMELLCYSPGDGSGSIFISYL